MMRNMGIAAVAALALGACTTVSPADSIRPIGDNLFSISEMHFFGGDVAGRAAAYCGSLGKRLQIEGDTTQKGMWSGDDYAVLVFSCQAGPR